MSLPTDNILLTLAVVLVAGVSFGILARRLHLPAVTGQILVGILLGASGFRIFGSDAVHRLQPITHFALGLIAVTIGGHLHFPRLRNAKKRLMYMLLLEASITPVLVFVAVLLLPSTEVAGTQWVIGVLLGAMAVSTAPATIIAIVKETRSKGVFVKTLVASVALNNLACICLFEVAHVVARVSLDPTQDHAWTDIVFFPLRQILLSVILGGGGGVVLVVVARRLIRPDHLATASLIAILLTAGLADVLHTSSLLSCLFLGMTLANLAPEKEEVGDAVFQNFEGAIYSVFFTLAGMELDFRHLAQAGVLALTVVLVRAIGKLAAARMAMRFAGATPRVTKYLGLALLPQAGVAVGLLLLVQEEPAFASVRDLLLAVGLTVVTVNEIVGPILTRMALARSGDFGKDRARLIDFIHEENITTNLAAGTKKEAIEHLTDLLIHSHRLQTDREKLLKSVLDREAVISTCIGGGLSIPHGVLEGGTAIVGVMGISHEGLALPTPDGIPVHCMVLLATPPDLRERHLEVLAALTRSIGSDRNIQRQLYHSGSPAHAYEILHAEEFEGFNYFLGDDGFVGIPPADPPR